MKKILVLILSLIAVMSLSAFTYDENKQHVFDYSNILNDSEEKNLEDLCKEYSINDKCDYVIVTTNDSEGKSIEAYADDFYDYNGFGYNKEMGDGTIFVVAFDTRKYWFSTSGNAINEISDSEISKINNKAEDELRNKDYYSAFNKYVITTSKAYNGSPEAGVFKTWWINLIIAVVISVIVTFVLGYQQKTKMTVSSRDYSKNMHSDAAGTWDRFVRTTTTRSRKSSDKGGSSHTGSSGNSHGGGGGSF